MASLTKIMTFYTCLRLVEKYKMTPKTTLVTISRTAASIPGTSANLREGDQLYLQDLFYGLMLPSGNDAAYALAEYFGGLLQAMKPHRQSMFISNTRLFIKEMNYNAMRLKLIHTQFDSSHGLPNKYNYSTAKDICHLTVTCMRLPAFRQVVGTRVHRTVAANNDKSHYRWDTTNKLLGKRDHWIGCKTGVTDPAGPCFSGYYENGADVYCIVVLKSKTMDQRWVEVPRMLDWVLL